MERLNLFTQLSLHYAKHKEDLVKLSLAALETQRALNLLFGILKHCSGEKIVVLEKMRDFL